MSKDGKVLEQYATVSAEPIHKSRKTPGKTPKATTVKGNDLRVKGGKK